MSFYEKHNIVYMYLLNTNQDNTYTIIVFYLSRPYIDM